LYEILLLPWENTNGIIRNASEGFQGQALSSARVFEWVSRFFYWFTPAQKNQTSEIKCQKNAELFLRHSRNCAQGIRSQGSDRQPGVLPGDFETSEGEVAKDKAGIVAIGRMAHS